MPHQFRRVAFGLLTIALCVAGAAPTRTQGNDTQALVDLLHQFLAGASRNDAAVHDRFWGDDLIYTSSAGLRMSKADVLRQVRDASAHPPANPMVYTAEDVQVHLYGDAAVVAFRLVGTSTNGGRALRNWNTGMFVKRDGIWKAVAWQSTVMPPPPIA
jgi:ketosteroid isomerase-like protein